MLVASPLCWVAGTKLSVVEETLTVHFPRVFDGFSKKLCHLKI